MNAQEVRTVLKILLGKKDQPKTSLLEDILPHAISAIGTFAAGELLARKAAPAPVQNVLPVPAPLEEKAASGVRMPTPEPAGTYLSWQTEEGLEKRLYDADVTQGRNALKRVLARKGIQVGP